MTRQNPKRAAPDRWNVPSRRIHTRISFGRSSVSWPTGTTHAVSFDPAFAFLFVPRFPSTT